MKKTINKIINKFQSKKLYLKIKTKPSITYSGNKYHIKDNKVDFKKGINLIVGNVGCGKTMLIYDYLSRTDKKYIVISSCIEYKEKLKNYKELNTFNKFIVKTIKNTNQNLILTMLKDLPKNEEVFEELLTFLQEKIKKGYLIFIEDLFMYTNKEIEEEFLIKLMKIKNLNLTCTIHSFHDIGFSNISDLEKTLYSKIKHIYLFKDLVLNNSFIYYKKPKNKTSTEFIDNMPGEYYFLEKNCHETIKNNLFGLKIKKQRKLMI